VFQIELTQLLKRANPRQLDCDIDRLGAMDCLLRNLRLQAGNLDWVDDLETVFVLQLGGPLHAM